MPHTARPVAVATTLALAVAALAAPSAAQDADERQAARDYCASVGGTVETRRATWNTNAAEDQWVDLGRSMEVCAFQSEDDGSRIYVEVETLYQEEPSLAAAAYLSRTPMPDELPPGNPATYHCADLGGSSQWGSGAQGGGWVRPDAPIDVVVAMCVFPDGSAIDDWGIAYYADGTVRGADLAERFRSDPQGYPPIFG